MSQGKCQALSGDAILCGKKTNVRISYFGDNEMYYYGSGKPSWVLVYLCHEHAGEKTI